VDIDCAGARARATLIDEVVKKINDGLATVDARFAHVASHDGQHLLLTSTLSGEGSRINFGQPRAADAMDKLLGVPAGITFGRNASAVEFNSIADLSNGIDLSVNNRIKIGFDGAAQVDITITGANPAQTTLNEVITAINQALGGTLADVTADGSRVALTSPQIGAASQIAFAVPDNADATQAIFGIAAPRTYQSDDAQPAVIMGQHNLSAGVDLRVSRFLCLNVDGGGVLEIDCAGEAVDPASAKLDEIIRVINGVAGAVVASQVNGMLVLRSPSVGVSARLELGTYFSKDAFSSLFGQAERSVQGNLPVPAVITGTVSLSQPINLKRRQVIRIAIDGSRPIDIPIHASQLEKSTLAEIVDSINTAQAGLVSVTDDNKLRLTSPTVGENSRLSVLPLRYLEVIEYMPAPTPSRMSQSVRHGELLKLNNKSASTSDAAIEISAPHGVIGPMLVNTLTGWRVRLLSILAPNQRARLWVGEHGKIQAVIYSADGTIRPVSSDQIVVGPIGGQVVVPFNGNWPLHVSSLAAATVQLNNPRTSALVILRTRSLDTLRGQVIRIAIKDADLAGLPEQSVNEGNAIALIGRLQTHANGYQLTDASGTEIVQLHAGADTDLGAYIGRSVHLVGNILSGTPATMVVQSITDLFDVTLSLPGGETESYLHVSIDGNTTAAYSLVRQIFVKPSQWVQADVLDKQHIFTLSRGQSVWRYMECYGWRYNQANFGSSKDNDVLKNLDAYQPTEAAIPQTNALEFARFAGDMCIEYGVFNVSRFVNQRPIYADETRKKRLNPGDTLAVYAPPVAGSQSQSVTVDFIWTQHQPGTFTVNLPVDLPPRFGARFNEARFSQPKDTPELYTKAVVDPPNDKAYLLKLINIGGDKPKPDEDTNDPNIGVPPSRFVDAALISAVPAGWNAVTIPFRKPQFLTLGRADQEARLYLAGEGLDKQFVELKAKGKGEWGNDIAVVVRQSGPAMYDVEIIYQGALFENARKIVMGKKLDDAGMDLPALLTDLLKPGLVGLLHAKAAGVQAIVTRDRTPLEG